MFFRQLFPEKQRLVQFFLSVCGFLLVSLLLCFFANGRADYFERNRLIIFCAVGFALLYYLWRCNIKFLITFSFFTLSYASTAYIKYLTGMPLNGVEILDAWGLGTIVCCVLAVYYTYLQLVHNKFVRNIGLGIFYLVATAFLLFPLLLWGYYIVSGGLLLTPDILLTLFQTNFGETKAYLLEQNLWRWLLAVIVLLCLLGLNVKLIKCLPVWQGKRGLLVFISVFVLFMLGNILPKLEACYAINVINETKGQLKAYSAYGEAKAAREQRLHNLQGLVVKPASRGIYVLVIGESATRNHMGVYGYGRRTTPWLESFAKDSGTVMFRNAYSCHTHTVPVLTYALSEKNQYNKIKLEDAYSIVEVAKAAGYDTYWLSNQLKFGAWDTPVAAIASTSAHQQWINGHVGKSLDTLYYDEKLVDALPNLQSLDNALIVVHLMGSHGAYADRYPVSAQVYKDGTKKIVDEYDNSVAYTDTVLQKLFEKIRRAPNYKAFIYLSDHGEDPDAERGHESTKFTWQMAHIPLFINCFSSFQHSNSQKFTALRTNINVYWTNDLLYDVMTSIMGIQGLPHQEESFNLASDKYTLPVNNAKTLHGQKSINDDSR